MKALGYGRVSTKGQEAGYSLGLQREEITLWAKRYDHELIDILTDSKSGSSIERPALQDALFRMKEGEAEILVVAKLDRLTRDIGDFAAITRQAEEHGWRLESIDMAGQDLSTPMGGLIGGIRTAVAEYERAMIVGRTQSGQKAAYAKGKQKGRPRLISPEITSKIRRWSEEGHSPHLIAEMLNDAGVPTAGGGKRWYKETIARVLERDAV